MKKHTILIAILLFTVLLLSACGGAQATDSGNQSSGLLNADYENALPVELQLALGTLKLDGTDQAVDAGQSAELLSLWKAMLSLGQSDTVAAEEMQALFKQIQETMTPEQIQAIADMQITGEDMAQIAQDLGLEFFGSGRFGDLTPEMQATMQAARESGQSPPGGFPGGGIPGEFPGGGQGFPGGGPGGGGFEGGQLNPEQQATLEARRATAGDGARFRIPTAVLNAVIDYLEAKVQ